MFGLRIRILDIVAWLLLFLVVTSFFMPWLKFPQDGGAPDPDAAVDQLSEESELTLFARYVLPYTEDKRVKVRVPDIRLSPAQIVASFHDKKLEPQRKDLVESHVLGFGRQEANAWLLFAAIPLAIFAPLFMSLTQKKWTLLLPLAGCFSWYLSLRYRLDDSSMERMSGPYADIGLWLAAYTILALCLLLFIRFLLPLESRL
ncbi:MAG: hypothetical protein ACAI35_25620 [Candidatus Methylacidiphilales bacterium]|nr:hypothetical protein [Candidatus Methylacidiphilales bacterium]